MYILTLEHFLQKDERGTPLTDNRKFVKKQNKDNRILARVKRYVFTE